MSAYTVDAITEAAWDYSSRTLDSETISVSDGSTLDDILYAIWAYSGRTLSTGTSSIPILRRRRTA